MKKWDGVAPLPCMEGMGTGTHLLVANQGGWGYLCCEKPERWQTMEGHPTDEPLIIPNSDQPTCTTCLLILTRNETTNLTKENWPVRWRQLTL